MKGTSTVPVVSAHFRFLLCVNDTCPLTESGGRLNLLHEADDDAVIWLESTATEALAK